jgi:CDP-paratose 2-epimerase
VTKILVTGACGFVGRTIIESLLESAAPGSFAITGLDNLSRKGSWINREPLERRGVRIVHGDIRLASDLETVGSIDWVIDAAANPSVLAGIDGKSSSRQLVEHNLSGTVNLLELCKARQAGFILLSTSRVYSIRPLAALPVIARDGAFALDLTVPLPAGVSESGISESFPTSPPVSLYGASKVASEQLALEYGDAFGFPVRIDRCGVMAGAGQFGRPDQGIFAYWLHAWREGRELTYIGFDGAGHQVRDCLHPRDLVPLLTRQLETRATSGDVQVVNVSGGAASATSLAQLSAWCAERWGKRTVASELTPRPFDLPWVVLDHARATERWNWRPETPVAAILEEIAAFADANPAWTAKCGVLSAEC